MPGGVQAHLSGVPAGRGGGREAIGVRRAFLYFPHPYTDSIVVCKHIRTGTHRHLLYIHSRVWPGAVCPDADGCVRCRVSGPRLWRMLPALRFCEALIPKGLPVGRPPSTSMPAIGVKDVSSINLKTFLNNLRSIRGEKERQTDRQRWLQDPRKHTEVGCRFAQTLWHLLVKA